MGDCLQIGKLSRYIANHQGQLSLSARPGYIKRVSACLAGSVKAERVYLRRVAGNIV